MTISSETRVSGPYSGNGSTYLFPFDFKVFSQEDVLVVVAPEDGGPEVVISTPVSLNPDQNANPGGHVIYLLPVGMKLTITSKLPYLQPVDITNQGGFYPRVINDALDRLTIFVQQLFSGVRRSIKVPLSDGEIDVQLPGREDRKGSVLAFDEEGVPIAGPTVGDVDTVLGNAAAIKAVADSIEDVETVADNIEDVTNFAGVYYGPSATDPTTRRDGEPLQDGDLYFNTDGGGLRVYDSDYGWTAATQVVDNTVVDFSGDGVETEFQLPYAPLNAANTMVYIDGVYQQKSEYTVTGDLLTFNEPPPAGTSNIEVILPEVRQVDIKLRDDLADPDKGAMLVARATMYAATVEDLQAIATDSLQAGQAVEVTTTGRAGLFRWDASDLSAEVAADPLGIEFVAPDGQDGSNGAWVRQHEGSFWPIELAGALGDGVTNDTSAFDALEDHLHNRGGGVIVLSPGKTYRIGSATVTPKADARDRVSIWAYGATVVAPDDSVGVCLNGLPGEDRFVMGGIWDGNWDGLGGAVAHDGQSGNQPVVRLTHGVRPIARDLVIRRAVNDGMHDSDTTNAVIEDVIVESAAEHGFYTSGGASGTRSRNCKVLNCGLNDWGKASCYWKVRGGTDVVITGLYGRAPDASQKVRVTEGYADNVSYINIDCEDLDNIASLSESSAEYLNTGYRFIDGRLIGKRTDLSVTIATTDITGWQWKGMHVEGFTSGAVFGEVENCRFVGCADIDFGRSGVTAGKTILRDVVLEGCGTTSGATSFIEAGMTSDGLTVLPGESDAVPNLLRLQAADITIRRTTLRRATAQAAPNVQIVVAGTHVIDGLDVDDGGTVEATAAGSTSAEGSTLWVRNVNTQGGANVVRDLVGCVWYCSNILGKRAGSGTVFVAQHANAEINYSGVGVVGAFAFSSGDGTVTDITQYPAP